MINPLISICIPAYNAALYIKEAIVGWQNQSYSNLEIIVQDDCSTDDTYEVALEIAKSDNRIQVFRNEKNLGIGANWNACYKKAKGDYVVIFNADDLIEPNFITEGLKIFKNNEVDLVTFKFKHRDIITKREYDHYPQANLLDGLIEETFEKVFFTMPFHLDFTLIKLSLLESILINGNQLFLETQICDADLWCRMALKTKIFYYSTYFAGYYVKHTTNNSYIPNGEKNSWLFVVFPLYFNYLKTNHKKATLKLLREKVFYEIKYSIKNKVLFDFKILNPLICEYAKVLF